MQSLPYLDSQFHWGYLDIMHFIPSFSKSMSFTNVDGKNLNRCKPIKLSGIMNHFLASQLYFKNLMVVYLKSDIVLSGSYFSFSLL